MYCKYVELQEEPDKLRKGLKMWAIKNGAIKNI